jgi:UDP-N-acetylglucosamine 1-carboxyvinyltransferase
MEKIKIIGNKSLRGKICISYSKNATLPLLAATLITKDTVILPLIDLLDVQIKLSLLENIGHKVTLTSTEIIITPSDFINNQLSVDLVSAIRSSILFLGPLLVLKRKISLHIPGGDDLGRTYDFHLDFLEKMGAIVNLENNMMHVSLPEKRSLQGIEYTLTKSSVGTTQHIILTAILCEKGTVTILNNASLEPECIFLIDVLKNQFKADIICQGSRVIIVGNGERLCTKSIHKIILIKDRIEALSYLSLSLITNGLIEIDCDNILNNMGTDLQLLTLLGGEVRCTSHGIFIKNTLPKLRSIKYFESGPFPGISTDFAPIFCTLLGVADGTSLFTETIHNNRFAYINEIQKFGGSMQLHKKKNTIIIQGSNYVNSQEGICVDIRGGMAILMAALRSDGISHIHNIKHLFRGYTYLIEKINSLGGNLTLIKS